MYTFISLGKPSNTDPQKNILVVGAADSGKRTLIDCLANYALGVKWQDKFTLRMTDGSKNQKGISVYTIPSTTQTKTPFAMNVVDMPGFSTVHQNPKEDKDAIDNLKKFIETPRIHGVDSVSAVWFVHHAQTTEISPMYNYIYKELVKLFGKQLGKMYANVVTFAGNAKRKVPVLKAIEESELPAESTYFVFKKSNKKSADENSEISWSDTISTLNDLSTKLESETPVSSCITTENLEKREQATLGLRQMSNLVRLRCQNIQVMEQEQRFIDKRVTGDTIIDQVQDFEYKVVKTVKIKRELPNCGEEVTNCSICFVTCHKNCAIVDDDDKKQCVAMKDGYCRVCPGKCFWDQHFNRAFQIFLRMEVTKKKFSDLPRKYEIDGKEKVDVLLKALHRTSHETTILVKDTLEKAAANIQLISEVSGRFTPSNYNDSIDIIIHEEMRDGMPDWENRVEILKSLKQKGKLGVRIKGKGHTEQLL